MTVRFVLEPDGYIDPVELPEETEVVALKEAIAADVGGGVEAHHLVVRFHGVVARRGQTLRDCGVVSSGGKGRVYEGSIVIDPGQTSHDYTMPDVLVVSVVDEGSASVVRDVWVRIEREEGGSKPFLGGFRAKRGESATGAEYHHASSQTPVDRKAPWEGKPAKFTRETQTTKVITRSAQTTRESSTQVDRPGLWMSRERDKEVAARPYFSADQLDALKAEKVLLLQRCWRGYLSRKRARVLRQERAEALARRDEARAQEEAAERERREHEKLRRMRPETVADFAALYSEVEAWRSAETARIQAAFAPVPGASEAREAERVLKLRVAHEELLARETRMLQEIERLRTDAKLRSADARVQRMLHSMAAPKLWQGSDGDLTEVVTPFTERARDLKALFEALADPALALSDRLDALLHLKWTVKEFDCGLTREIAELVDRETDLVTRSRPSAMLDGLRRRILHLFLQFIETPEFNPEAATHLRVPRDLASRPNVMPIRGGKRGKPPRLGRDSLVAAQRAQAAGWVWKPDAPAIKPSAPPPADAGKSDDEVGDAAAE